MAEEIKINTCFNCRRFDCSGCPVLEGNEKQALEQADAISSMFFGSDFIGADRLKEE